MQVPILSSSSLERMAPPGARRLAPRPDRVELSGAVAPSEEKPVRRLTWKHGLAAGLMAAGAVAGIIGVTLPGGESLLEAPVAVNGSYTFPQPVLDVRDKAVQLQIQVPPELRERGDVSVQVSLQDSAGFRQTSTWNAGLPVPENPGYDPATGRLTLTYDPSSALESFQGGTDAGFDPALLMHGLTVRVNSSVPLQLESARLIASPTPPAGPAQERPLLRAGGRPHPLRLSQMKHGVSQYFVYGDLHHFDQARPVLERTLAAQQRNGLDSFRWMGGLDVRQTAGGVRVGDREMGAMREALDLADRYGQKHLIFTLLDGAIPNQTLQRAMNGPAARRQLVESLRPFVREFGQRDIVWDLINEIHGVADVSEAGRQALVEELVKMVSQEAPGATVTVGVQNFRELRHWSYLSEKFPQTRFLYTFHLYEDVDRLPNAWDLNLPPNAEVGITEADPARGMGRQIQGAARKGYSWMLFWEDSRFDYSPEAHAGALRSGG